MSIVRECISSHTIRAQYQIHTFSFSLSNDIKSQIQFVIFYDRITNFSTLSFCKSISHTTAKNQVIHFIHQVFNDTNLSRHLGTTHNSSERALDIFQDIINSLNFFFHQIPQHLVVRIEIVSDNGCRSMFTVSSTECVIDIAISIRSQSLGKFFLRSLHRFLGIFVCRIFFVNANRLSFFFRIETQVFQQQDFTRFQSSCSITGFRTIRSKLNRYT